METKLLDILYKTLELKLKETSPNEHGYKAGLLFCQSEIQKMQIDLLKHEINNYEKTK
jgi:hypothetical protein